MNFLGADIRVVVRFSYHVENWDFVEPAWLHNGGVGSERKADKRQRRAMIADTGLL